MYLLNLATCIAESTGLAQYLESNLAIPMNPLNITFSVEGERLGMKSLEGQKAPAFSLEGHDGKTHSLDDYRGQKVILFFYPKDSTPG